MSESDSQILTELRSIKGMVRNQGKTLKDHEKRIGGLEEKDKIEAAVKIGIDAYLKDQGSKTDDNLRSAKLKLFKDLAPLIVAATALLYAVISRFQ